MCIYIVTSGLFPNGMAPAKRRLCFAKALIQEGVNCKVLVFSRIDTRIQNVDNNGINGNYEGVPFEFIGKDVKTKNRFVSKLRALQSQIILLSYLNKNLMPGDVIYAYVNDKSRLLMDLVIRITHKKGAKYVRELCELPYGQSDETTKTIKNRGKLLSKQFPKYDGVVAISNSLAKLAHDYVNDYCKIFILPILVEYNQFELEDLSDRISVQYIFHSGTLTEQKDGILGMIEAFGMASKQLDFPVQFISTGNKEKSKFSREIDALAAKYELSDKLFFRGFVDNDTLRQYLQGASMVIINKYPTQQNEYCFSTKLGEYMAAGKAIIVTNVGEAMNWLTNKKDSIIVETQNLKELSNAIIELFKNSELRKEIGENARETCKNSFDYRVYGLPLKRYFSSLIQEKK